jgi:hypothetical protein
LSSVPSKFLNKMLERLYAALSSGPALNCRPHNSRQRFDVCHLERLDGVAAHQVIAALLRGEEVTIRPARTQPTGIRPERDAAEPDQSQTWEAWEQQQAVLGKLKIIAEDARTYEQDNGAQVLYVGYPILQLPPAEQKSGRTKKRIVAPIAFVPVSLTVKAGRSQAIVIAARAEGRDKVIANTGLFAWLEQQTGKKFAEIDPDEHGEDPWKEINDLTKLVADALQLKSDQFGEGTVLSAIPKADGEEGASAQILRAAIMGLFPIANLGLIRDTEAMLEGEPLQGGVPAFVQLDAALLDGTAEAKTAEPDDKPAIATATPVKEELLVSDADPCQARAVRLARTSRALVVHGPPGTGKSQTITNIIGDHLARGERVLFVCDKRTALDVVWHRLEHLGLAPLCAVVYDAQRDQRDLYMSVRDQLEELADQQVNPQAATQLRTVGKDLKKVHNELLEIQQAFAHSRDGDLSFHELVGRWLEIETAGLDADLQVTPDTQTDLGEVRGEIALVLERAAAVEYATNPWRRLAGIALSEFLQQPISTWQARFQNVKSVADRVSQTETDLPLATSVSFGQQGSKLRTIAQGISAALRATNGDEITRWNKKSEKQIASAHQLVSGFKKERELLGSSTLEPAFAVSPTIASASDADVNAWIAKLAKYLEGAQRWYGFLLLGQKKDAAAVLTLFGAMLSVGEAQRVHANLKRIQARRMLEHAAKQVGISSEVGITEGEFVSAFEAGAQAIAVVHTMLTEPLLAASKERLGGELADAALAASVDTKVSGMAERASALDELDRAARESKLICAEALQADLRDAADGTELAPLFADLASRFPTLDSLLRLKAAVAELPTELRGAVEALAIKRVAPQQGMAALERSILHAKITERLAKDPALSRTDAQRFQALENQYAALEQQKRALVKDTILAHWRGTQKQRLLAMTGSRLNSDGAELKRRLTLRGERAMKIRQVIAIGQKEASSDPLFDVKPLWMASPQTVAQIFPRKPLFDVIIFDEASQCRLEEAIPVLARGKRLVIAGDPKQLPPTRFFETAVAVSQEEEPNTDQELFEQQQAEMEDLLSAALNLEVDQSYLDVHYRSTNSDLIAFSNEQFYNRRLQPIPAHPRNIAKFPPITLARANGVYDKRENEAEAKEVLRIVKGLLSSPEPPSIGIACFNLTQRDLILDVLETAAADDSQFAAQYAAARQRKGRDSFEGLFVKNLENVQGDERDHIIISTTYGPDPKGKFYRRFGPLGQAGGGRRLNVLVTRARKMVHLVTSIPREQYSSFPPVVTGQVPGGGWLLFSYLRFAELLDDVYREADEKSNSSSEATPREVVLQATETPSKLAAALGAMILRQRDTGTIVHWGNEGFCVDVALRHPNKPQDVTAGVLCDLNRYRKAEDPVEWELFRTAVLKSQGWGLVRALSPQLFRDAETALLEIDRTAQIELALAAKVHQA